MTITWRLLLFSGLISLIIGIVNVTSLLEVRSDGLNVWGYILLFWGIAAIMSALNQFKYNALIKVLAAAGILLNGSQGIYSFLFPGNVGAGEMNSSSVLYALASFVAALCCMMIIGKRIEDTPSKSVSK
ncbi:hypothetical protein AWM68_04075 [Fictibacillus phosphorivorans]|uniref:Uncharacterized protein n=1 Tax=Fictibacillus phosphorivorans TaxID=1221500 RepID=A0A165P9Q2_9BACL|nr:hypothetical protein [Fictibacillus phosphorivorans]KZE69450.1 hypothetical protein AWM68_04075 [Fictibacillus phosphorivorans]